MKINIIKAGGKEMSKTKRNVTILAVLLCLSAAVYLNWAYNSRSADEVMADAELAASKAAEEQAATEGLDALVSDYFAQARLTRQQSRDEAIDLLETAAASESASQETIDSAVSTIAVMANYSMLETQVENLLLAKEFEECVAFMSAEGVTLAVPSPAEGLSAEEVARITDAIIAETDFTAAQIKLIEVKSGSAAPQEPESAETVAEPQADAGEAGVIEGEGSENVVSEYAQTEQTGEILE